MEMDNWVQTIHKRRWKWAGKVIRLDETRWARIALFWSPKNYGKARRNQGGQYLRWAEDIDHFCKNIFNHCFGGPV